MEGKKINVVYILVLPLLAGFIIWSRSKDKEEFRNDTRTMYEKQFEYIVLNKTKDYKNHGLITVQFLDLNSLQEISFDPSSIGMGDDLFARISKGDTVIKIKNTNYFSIRKREVIDSIYFDLVE